MSLSSGQNEVSETSSFSDDTTVSSYTSRQDSQYFTNTPSMSEPSIQVAQHCHIGLVRKRNEDSCFTAIFQSGGQETLPLIGVFAVADGMGGHRDGHKASRIVSRTFAHTLLDDLYMPLLRNEVPAVYGAIENFLEKAVAAANAAIYSPDPDQESGTTLTAGLVFGRQLYVAHIGDSRAYLFSDWALQRLTKDHSLVQRLKDAGHLTDEQAQYYPQNLLYRAMTGAETNADLFTCVLPQKGQLLFCSDGLWGLVSDEQISEVLERDLELQQKADMLVELALEAGGNDNITAVLVSFDF